MENRVSHILSEKKIDIKDLKPGMVVAKDIVSQSGLILLAKDTLINESNYSRLVEGLVDEVVIKEAIINIQAKPVSGQMQKSETTVSKPAANTPPQPLPEIIKKPGIVSVKQRKEFINFANVYDKKLEVTKDHMDAISAGEKVNIEELYTLTESVINKLGRKSDILTFIGFLKDYDEYTYSHSSNVALLANLFASWVSFDEAETMNLTTAGLLHDIGKLRIPHEILNKKGRLIDEEYEVMKTHPVIGYRLLEHQNIPQEIKLAALMHHERIDGSGYPIGAHAEHINKFAKIIAICDIYDAMTSKRIYRGRICPFDVIKQFEVSSFGELDTNYLLFFLKNIAYTYFGSWVMLSDGTKGEVVFINQSGLSRPTIRVGEQFIDLQKRQDLKIVEVL